MGEYERIVIGAGPAGCAVALRLAAAGQRPLLLERSRAVRPRLCGEFVSAEAAAALAALGVDVAALGGRETRHLRLAFGRQCIEAELPFTAFGLSRAALDAALQARVQAAGVPLWRGARASLREVATARRPHRLCVTLPDGTAAALHTRSLLLACGKTDLAPLQRRPRRAPESLSRRRRGPSSACPMATCIRPVRRIRRGCGAWAIRQPSFPRSPATAWPSRCTAPPSLPKSCWPAPAPCTITGGCSASCAGRWHARPPCTASAGGSRHGHC